MLDEFTEMYERCAVCCCPQSWTQLSERSKAWEKPSIRACEDCRDEARGHKLLSPIPPREWWANV